MRIVTSVLATLVVVSLVAGAELVDQVAATVDKEAILMSDLMEEVGTQLRELRAKATSQADLDRIVTEKLRETLDQAIDNRLLLREGQLAGIPIEDTTIDQRFNEMRKGNDNFDAELERMGMSAAAVKERIKKQMIARTMAVRKTAELEKGIAISESDVAQY